MSEQNVLQIRWYATREEGDTCRIVHSKKYATLVAKSFSSGRKCDLLCLKSSTILAWRGRQRNASHGILFQVIHFTYLYSLVLVGLVIFNQECAL
jgi:hypothetical protein